MIWLCVPTSYTNPYTIIPWTCNPRVQNKNFGKKITLTFFHLLHYGGDWLLSCTYIFRNKSAIQKVKLVQCKEVSGVSETWFSKGVDNWRSMASGRRTTYTRKWKKVNVILVFNQVEKPIVFKIHSKGRLNDKQGLNKVYCHINHNGSQNKTQGRR
jgi:hypothetical protein